MIDDRRHALATTRPPAPEGPEAAALGRAGDLAFAAASWRASATPQTWLSDMFPRSASHLVDPRLSWRAGALEDLVEDGVACAYAVRPVDLGPRPASEDQPVESGVALSRFVRGPGGALARIDTALIAADRFAAAAPSLLADPALWFERAAAPRAPARPAPAPRRNTALDKLLGPDTDEPPAPAAVAEPEATMAATTITDADRAAARGVLARLTPEGAEVSAAADAPAFWRSIAALAEATPEPWRPMLAAASGLSSAHALGLLTAGGAAEPGSPADPADAKAWFRSLRERLADAPSPLWIDAATGAAAYQSLLLDAAEIGPPQRGLERFLVQRQAPPPSDADDAFGFLRGLVSALDAGVAFGRSIPVFGQARAAGLLALSFDDDLADAWEALLAQRPHWSIWTALWLRTPDWAEDAPVAGLSALGKFAALETALRDALPPGAETPLDGPAFRSRARHLAEHGAAAVDQEPQMLWRRAPTEDAAAAAPWLAILAEAEPNAVAATVAALQAVRRAAALSDAHPAAAPAIAQALATLGAAPPDITEEAAPDMSSDAQDSAETAADFAARWAHAALGGAPQAAEGAGFWMTALDAWFAAAADALDAPAYFGAIAAVERAAAAAPRPAIAALLEPATHRGLARYFAEADNSDALARQWLTAEAAGSTAAPALLARLSRGGQLDGATIGPVADAALDAVSALASAGDAAALFGLSERLLRLLTELGPPAADTAARFVAGLSEHLEALPQEQQDTAPPALIDAALRAIVTLSEPAAPIDVGGGALAAMLRATLGDAIAELGLGLPPAAEHSADGEPEARAAALAFFAEGGIAAQRMLAAGAIRRWRQRFEAEAAARADGAPAKPFPLSPYKDAEATLCALRAIETTALEDPQGAKILGADILWTVQQFLTLPVPARDRPRGEVSHLPAPPEIRAAWARLSGQSAAAEPVGPDGFFLFFATKLFAEAAEAGATDRPVIGPAPAFFLRETYGVREAAGVVEQPVAKWLREFVFLERVTERADHISALSAEEIGARLDRALLFLNLMRVEAYGDRSDPAALWQATPIPEVAAERLDPPEKVLPRLTRHLDEDPAARGALAWTFDRALLWRLPGWGGLKSEIIRP